MNKIEFSDVYRFLASLGLIFIGLAFFLPWFINQNNSTLILEQDKIQKLTSTAQLIISKQQNTLLKINQFLPYISITLIIIGIILLIIGVLKWEKRQTVLDKIQDEDLKSKEIQNITSKEKRDLIENDINKSEVDVDNIQEEAINIKGSELQTDIDNYIQIENSIFLQLSQNYKSKYTATQNVRIEDSNYDIILKSKDITLYKDKIIEIKFFKKQLTYEILKDAATTLIFSCVKYEKNFKRRTLPILIIIYTMKEYDEHIKLFKSKLELFGKDLGKPLKINFFEKENIANIKSDDLIK